VGVAADEAFQRLPITREMRAYAQTGDWSPELTGSLATDVTLIAAPIVVKTVAGRLSTAGEVAGKAPDGLRGSITPEGPPAAAGKVAGAAPKGASTPPVNELPSSGNKFVVDPKGNTIVVKPGETVTSSPDGNWIQVKDAEGTPTGTRLDGGHKPAGHPDPRAQEPHAHVPGVTNPDGTPWLPVNK